MGKAAEARQCRQDGSPRLAHPDIEGQGRRRAGTTSSAKHNGKHLQERER